MADRLGVSRVELVHLEAMIRARRSFGQQRPPQADVLDKAYESLGLQAAATDEEVKTAYRRLMNQHHPDKQAARGLPDSMRQMAEERTLEIRAAYDLIRERRGLR
jgi:DnaJ like chaperone protein